MTVLTATAAHPGRGSVLLALAKPRLNALAVATVGIGYYLGAPELDLVVLLCVLAGSALVDAAAKLNGPANRVALFGAGETLRVNPRLADAGHMLMAEAPGAVTRCLRGFLGAN